MLIVPFLLGYDRVDHHVVQFLPDHPKYEMAEMMITEREDEPLLWFFVTERTAREGSKHQIHYTSQSEWADQFKASPGNREAYFREIKHSKSMEKGRTHFIFELDTLDGKVVWDFWSRKGELSPKYGGLAEQMGHDAKGHILVFYGEKRTLADKPTCLTIGENKYPIQVWKEISRRPFFTAYRGAYSTGIGIGRLAAGEQIFELVSKPEEYAPGEKWTYRLADGMEAIYSIVEREGQTLKMQEGSKIITAELAEDEVKIKKIELRQRDGNLALQFQPSFPDLGKMKEGEAALELSIEIDGHPDQMAGSVKIEKQQGKAKVLFAPTKPDWAAKNNMEVEIDVKDTSYHIRAKTIYLG